MAATKRGKAPYIPQDVFTRVLEAQQGLHQQRNQAILHLSHYLGLRAMELAALRVGDVLDPATGGIRETVRLLASMTKGNKFREVFLVNEAARDHLQKYLTTRPSRSDAPLFLSQKGGAFSPNTMQKLLHNIYAKANVKATSHSGRRTFATNLNERGADIYAIMEMMGHASIVTTQEYLTNNPERLKRFASRL